jgi:hypothetical protein
MGEPGGAARQCNRPLTVGNALSAALKLLRERQCSKNNLLHKAACTWPATVISTCLQAGTARNAGHRGGGTAVHFQEFLNGPHTATHTLPILFGHRAYRTEVNNASSEDRLSAAGPSGPPGGGGRSHTAGEAVLRSFNHWMTCQLAQPMHGRWADICGTRAMAAEAQPVDVCLQLHMVV